MNNINENEETREIFEPEFDVESMEEPVVIPGPLSKFPAGRHLKPALICLLLFYAATSINSDPQYSDLLWVSGEKIFSGREFWRLFTALFVHGSLLHLLSNLFMFTIFGWLLRAYYGFMVFPAVSFFLGGLVNLAVVSVYEPGVRLVGASGMIYAMASMWLIFFLRHDTERTFPMRLLRVTGFTLAMLIPSAVEPQVSYLAHGIGFLAGIIAALLLLPFVRVNESD